MMNQSSKDKLHAYHLDTVARTYIRYFQKKLGFDYGGKKKGKRHEGHHCFIPYLDSANTVDHIRTAKAHIHKKKGGPLKFLDCGCGIGNIMILAYATGGFSKTDGIEYDLSTWRVAKDLAPPSSKVFRGDLIEFKHYADYDVIYYYEPISDPVKRNIFLKKVMDDAKVGAVIIAHGGGGRLQKSKKFGKVRRDGRSGSYHPIWEKIKK
jgi:hypothetical protein